MIRLILILACFISNGAMATSMSTIFGPPPQPISNQLTYSDLYAYFIDGTAASEQLLLGEWKEVASYNSSNCKIASDLTDWAGIKNSDDSIRTLTFNYQQKPIPGPEPVLNVFSVTLTNLGKKNLNQGPYRIQAIEPQFSRWAYVKGVLSNKGYFENSCRLVAGNNKQLICSMHLELTDTATSSLSDITCMAEQNGAITLFVKVTP